MREMIERVARAICEARGVDPDSGPATINSTWDNPSLPVSDSAHPAWMDYIHAANAAIQALRHPTEEMIQAGYLNTPAIPLPHDAQEIWGIMIEHALK